MRVHADTLDSLDLYQAASIAQVDLEFTRHGSRSRDHAFNVTLRGNSNRRPNLGTGGRSYDDTFAATWDQWGVFIGYLFECDPNLTIPYAYKDAEEFYRRTQGRFDLEWDEPVPFSLSHDHHFEFAGVPFHQTCTKCGATQSWER